MSILGIDRFRFGDEDWVPEGCEGLVEELEALEIEERPSFGPELAAELEREWARAWMGEPSRRSLLRPLLAACLAAVLAGGLAVPSARGAMARFVQAVVERATGGDVASYEVPEPVATTLPPDPIPLPAPTEERPETPRPRTTELPPATMPVGESAFPELLDPDEARRIIERYYPTDLQAAGIGGSVTLAAWVDETGRVTEARIEIPSAIERLNAAALAAAPLLRFRPAVRFGSPVGTWVEFPVTFEAQPESTLPRIDPVADPEPPALNAPALGDPSVEPEWDLDLEAPPAPYPEDARGLLARALHLDEAGSSAALDGLLAGRDPAHVVAQRWREDAVTSLERALHEDPTNPAPYLALGRLRLEQGLPAQALGLFEAGLAAADDFEEAVPDDLLGELHFARGTVLVAGWNPWRSVGRVPASDLAAWPCARAARPATGTYADGDVLIAWNYLCPTEFDRLMRAHFEPVGAVEVESRRATLDAFHHALEVDPGHVGANVAISLELADEGRWKELLARAEAFIDASRAHPQALLLSGMANHRLARSQAAKRRFEAGLAALPPEVATRMMDVRHLDPDQQGSVGPDPVRFWRPLDPLLSTPENEREMEHLARATYALLRFGSLDNDAATVWVLYGRPDRVRAIGDDGGLRTVFWDYGPGPDLTFRRPAEQTRMELTTEGAAYLRELRRVLPHRPNGAGPLLVPLQARLEIANEPNQLRLEVTVDLDVPAELMSLDPDTLDLGIFFLADDGTRWPGTRLRVLATSDHIQVRAPVPEGADEVVLELRDPPSGRAAVLRTTLLASLVPDR